MANELERKYQELLKDSEASQKAYHYLIKNTQIEKLVGNDKIQTIDMCDQETLLKGFNKGFPVIGNIYSFIHNSKIPIIINDLEYHDIFPIFFCLNVGNNFTQGINLNIVNHNYRWKLLIEIMKSNQELYDNFNEYIKNNKIMFNNKLINYIKNNSVTGLILYLEKILNYNLTNAYRTYYYKDITNFRLVEVPEWPYIPFLNSKELFKMQKIISLKNTL